MHIAQFIAGPRLAVTPTGSASRDTTSARPRHRTAEACMECAATWQLRQRDADQTVSAESNYLRSEPLTPASV
jgi:hypothetical protein